MDQSIISGVGNYLRSEILWVAKISPYRKVLSDDKNEKILSPYELKKLYCSLIKIIWCYYDLSKALKNKIITKKELTKFNSKI